MLKHVRSHKDLMGVRREEEEVKIEEGVGKMEDELEKVTQEEIGSKDKYVCDTQEEEGLEQYMVEEGDDTLGLHLTLELQKTEQEMEAPNVLQEQEQEQEQEQGQGQEQGLEQEERGDRDSIVTHPGSVETDWLWSLDPRNGGGMTRGEEGGGQGEGMREDEESREEGVKREEGVRLVKDWLESEFEPHKRNEGTRRGFR